MIKFPYVIALFYGGYFKHYCIGRRRVLKGKQNRAHYEETIDSIDPYIGDGNDTDCKHACSIVRCGRCLWI